MAEVETVFMRGEGGSVIPMDLPLPYDIARRVEAGHIVRVNADGTDFVPPKSDSASDPVVDDEPASVDAGAAAPKPAAPKADWVTHAQSHGLSHDEADAMTKAALVEKFGK